MPDALSHEAIQALVNRLLKGELPRIELPDGASRPSIAVIPVKTSGGRRPDGLRDDAPENPGFSFAVAEALIEVDRKTLSDDQFARIHRILWEAGTDDFMDYSHLNQFEPDAVPKDAIVALSFSSAAKAANIIAKLLDSILNNG